MDSLARKQDPVTDETVPVIALLAAATAGVVAQGGFYLPGRILVTLLAAVAFGLAFHARRDLLAGLNPVLGTAAAVGAWALLRGVTVGGLPVAAAVTTSLATLVAALAVVRRTGHAGRVRIVSGLVALGTLVAVTGWAGVAWRIERWAVLVESTLWRASSTLTYANAAAAVLAVTALLALALMLEQPGGWWWPCAAYLTQVGLAATLSRAGALAFAAGLLVLAAAAGVRAVLRHALPAGIGAVVALASLVPSFPVAAAPRPLLAVGGLLIGGVVAVLVPRLPGRVRLAAWTVLVAAAVTAGVVIRRWPAGLDALLDRRATLASRGRSGATDSALDLVAAHPVAGSGPGQARFFWTDHTGQLVVGRWVHNEYLQWLVDLGAIGLVLLLALGAALFLLVRRGAPAAAFPRGQSTALSTRGQSTALSTRGQSTALSTRGRSTGLFAHSRSAGWFTRGRSIAVFMWGRRDSGPAPLWAGGAAAITALALHSAFDFLWELAVVPLLLGVLVGIAGPSHGEESAPSSNGEVTP